MENATHSEQDLNHRIAHRLKQLRSDRNLSLDQLASRSGVSRASLSRLETGAVSPTAAVLGKLCAVFGLTMSRLMAQIEEDFRPLLKAPDQIVWEDPETGFRRRSVSPPSASLEAELLEGTLPAGRRIAYPMPPVVGLEHHLYLLEGQLTLTVDGRVHQIEEGDCLRYRLRGESIFATPPDRAARYLLAIV